MWRKLQEVGNNEEVKEWFRLFLELPFVPVPHILKAFQLIACNYQPTSVLRESVMKFNSYFERTWIMGNFRLEVWNHFRSDVRSNNICEGYNSRLARRAKRTHLNTYRLISLLKSEQTNKEAEILQTVSAPRRRKIYEKVDEKLFNLGLEYMLCDIDLITYIRSSGYIIAGRFSKM